MRHWLIFGRCLNGKGEGVPGGVCSSIATIPPSCSSATECLHWLLTISIHGMIRYQVAESCCEHNRCRRQKGLIMAWILLCCAYIAFMTLSVVVRRHGVVLVPRHTFRILLFFAFPRALWFVVTLSLLLRGSSKYVIAARSAALLVTLLILVGFIGLQGSLLTESAVPSVALLAGWWFLVPVGALASLHGREGNHAKESARWGRSSK